MFNFKQKATLYNTTSDRSRILDKDNDQSSPGHSDDAVAEAESSISNHDIDADDFSEEQYQEEEGAPIPHWTSPLPHGREEDCHKEEEGSQTCPGFSSPEVT